MEKNAAQKKYQKTEKYRKTRKKWLDENRAWQYERMARWRRENPARVLLSLARRRAKQKGLEFMISLNDIEIPERCPVLDIPFVLGGGKVGGWVDASPTLDRIDNSKGYVPGNVAVISFRANALKKDATLEEMEAVLKYMRLQCSSV
jgi:hypothetical protein